MKKQRAHKASRAAKRDRKARASARAAEASLVAATTADAVAHAVSSEPARSSRQPQPVSDAWKWHAAARHGGPKAHVKGPPPRRPAHKRPTAAAAPKAIGSRGSKLAPHLAALLELPAETASPATTASLPMRRAVATRWREDRIAAAVLLVPTLLVTGLLMLWPRQRAPLDQSPVVAVWRGPPPTSPVVAETTAIPARYPPPFLRTAERTLSHVPTARHDLDEVTPALSAEARRVIAMAGPPFTRPAERAMSHVPTARHDLDAVTPALSAEARRVIAMAGPPFTRPAERAMSHVPTARHDLDAVTPALSAEARRVIAMAGPPFTRPAERATQSVPPAAHDLPAVVAAMARDIEARRVAARVQPAPSDPTTPFTRAPEGTLLSQLPDTATLDARQDAGTCRPEPSWQARLAASRSEPVAEIAEDPTKFGLALAEAAKAQISELVIYNAKYMTIAYPRGDVPELFGVCTDVVIRAYRTLGIDLQELVHQTRPRGSDTSIDHRRTELLRQFFATHGEQLATSPFVEDYLPGDIVTYHRPQNKSSQSHIAVVTDVIASSGRPMIAHNRGWGVQLEDALFVDQMTGHYRYRGPRPADALVAANKTGTARTVAAAKALRQTVGAQGTAGLATAQPAEVRKGSAGQQTAIQPASSVLLASTKPVLGAAAQRMGLGAGVPRPAVTP